MVESELADLIGRISALLTRLGATKGILFGSRVRGDALTTSDVDLVVISDRFEGIPFARRLNLVQDQWESNLFLEALPYTPDEFTRLSQTRGVVRAALEEGIEILPH